MPSFTLYLTISIHWSALSRIVDPFFSISREIIVLVYFFAATKLYHYCYITQFVSLPYSKCLIKLGLCNVLTPGSFHLDQPWYTRHAEFRSEHVLINLGFGIAWEENRKFVDRRLHSDARAQPETFLWNYCPKWMNNRSVQVHNDVIKMETFSALLAFFAGNSPVTGEFPAKKASNAELWYLLRSAPEPTVEQTMETPVIWDAIALFMTSL